MFSCEKTERDIKTTNKDIFIDEKNSSVNFPFNGPPGSGPGLLGSCPGSLKTEYLVALEHHANNLKNVLTIIAALKKEKSKDLDVEVVYDSICDIESELQNSRNNEH